MQRYAPLFCIALLACTAAPRASADHTDVILEVAAGQITTNSAPATPEDVFESELGELGIPGFTDDPGFASSTLPPAARVGYNVLDGLLFWDGSTLGAAPAGERLEISLLGLLQTTVTESTGFQGGPFFAQASGSGAIHQHLSFYVKAPDFDEGDPFDNPISTGAYVLVMELYSDALDSSTPWAIVFNNGLSQGDFDAGVEAVRDHLDGPACPGDITGDGAVDLSDLSQLLAHFGEGAGQTYADGDLDGDGDVDLSDLSGLLVHFGETCG